MANGAGERGVQTHRPDGSHVDDEADRGGVEAENAAEPAVERGLLREAVEPHELTHQVACSRQRQQQQQQHQQQTGREEDARVRHGRAGCGGRAAYLC